MARLRVATSQFPVSAEVGANERWVVRQVRAAAEQEARLVHLPEAALSGYAGVDRASFADLDWDELRAATERVMALAGELGVWVVVGSAHPLGAGHGPHNCLYVIDDRGRLVERYDKRFCSGDPSGRTGDLAHYTPGDHTTVWEVDGVRCGALVCYDVRFPELHRELLRAGAQLVLHSFHTGGVTPARLAAIGAAMGEEHRQRNPAPTYSYPGVVMPASVTAMAAANHMWVSASTSCARESLWPAFVTRSDGVCVGRLRRNVPGLLVTEVDTEADVYDSTAGWRDVARAGTLHSGTTVDHPRSADRTSL